MARVIPIEDLRRSPTAALFEGGDDVAASIFVTEYARGQGPALHLHPYAEVFVVLAGTAAFTAGEEQLTVPAGHIVVVPAQTPHGFKGAGDDTLRVVSVHPSRAVEQTDLAGRTDEFLLAPPSNAADIDTGSRFPPERRNSVMQQRITPNLWFDTQAEEAANFYVSAFSNSRIVNVTHYTEAGPREAGMVMTVEFELDGQRFVAINGGPEFTFDEALSLQINCATQDEIDRYWEKLSEGGSEGPCGWLKDRYGLSWQVVPTGMEELFNDPDRARAERAMHALLGMGKLDIATLRAAADGVPAS